MKEVGTLSLNIFNIKNIWRRTGSSDTVHRGTMLHAVLNETGGKVSHSPAQPAQSQAAAAPCKALHSRWVCLMPPAIQLYILLRRSTQQPDSWPHACVTPRPTECGATAATAQDHTHPRTRADRTAAAWTALLLGKAVLPSTSHLPVHYFSP